MSFWSWLTAGGKAVDTASDVVRGAMSGIDALVLTDEEEIVYGMQKTELKLKVADSLASHVKDTLSESTARSTARRWIAKSIIKVWLSMMLINIPIYIYDPSMGMSIFEIAKAYQLGTAVLMVLAFYFSLYGLQIAKKAWGKDSGN